jgi:small subunit ribosomal protein S4
MSKNLSGCRKCRQVGIKLCSKGPKCAIEKRPVTPGQHGKKIGLKKKSEYGRQLQEKQKIRLMYGVRERQFRKFFNFASSLKGVTGEVLLSLLERRLDNVVYRLKMSATRSQSRQVISHGNILINGSKVTIPSYLVNEGDVITLSERALTKKEFLSNVVDRRMNMGIRVPEWLELQKKERKGVVLRNPMRTDIVVPIEEHLIVELYSK